MGSSQSSSGSFSSSSASYSHSTSRSNRYSAADKLAAKFKSKYKLSPTASTVSSSQTTAVSTTNDHTTTLASTQPSVAVTNTDSSSLPSLPTEHRTQLKTPSTPTMPPTVPCQYRTGKTLGSGTYAIVKEAIHIRTGKYYACKVINKKLMEGREHMVRNEIAVLKKISSGHTNIVTLHDYFETSHNLYLCFDLCTGGELFDRICAKGNYYEADAADLIRTIFKAVVYLHDSGVVHRDLKPENLLFRSKAEDADIMIADFGLSRVMEEEKLSMLTEICGTPGYMAPEIFKKTGHSKPVDVWAMGVITYFLLAGYTPFDRENQQQEMEAIIAGDYKFEPDEYWANVSDTAKDFVRQCLTVDPKERWTAREALGHQWLADIGPHFVPDPDRADGGPADLLPHVKKAFNAKQLWKKAAFSIRAVNRMAALANSNPTEAVKLRQDVTKYQEESELEVLENQAITHHHLQEHPSDDSMKIKPEQASLTPGEPTQPVEHVAADTNDLQGRLARTSLGK